MAPRGLRPIRIISPTQLRSPLAIRAFSTYPSHFQQLHRQQDSSKVDYNSQTGGATPNSTPEAQPSPESSSEQQEASSASQDSQQDQDPKQSKSEPEESSDSSDDNPESEPKKKSTPPPPPPHGGKTPWQVFTETLNTEFRASKEWNDSTKALSSGYDQFTQNEQIRKAREAYEASQKRAASAAGAAIMGTASVVGKGAAWTWDTSVVKGVRKGVNMTGRVIDKSTKPVRETETYKAVVGNVREVVDDGSSSRYGGWVEKDERRRRRLQREGKLAPTATPTDPSDPLSTTSPPADGETPPPSSSDPTVTASPKTAPAAPVEDPNAGTNITLHKDAAWKEAWTNFKSSNPMMQRLFSFKSALDESDNPVISTARSITDRIAGFFAENETAMVIKRFREMDPSFDIEPFVRELREWILPEVLDAYVKGDVETLRLWLSEAQYSVYAALAKQYTVAGLRSDGRVLDIRHVDIASARLLEPGEIPVFIVTARAQEVHVYRNTKTGQLAAGMEDKVQLVSYAIGVTRLPEEVNNPETRGWRLIELQKTNRDYI